MRSVNNVLWLGVALFIIFFILGILVGCKPQADCKKAPSYLGGEQECKQRAGEL